MEAGGIIAPTWWICSMLFLGFDHHIGHLGWWLESSNAIFICGLEVLASKKGYRGGRRHDQGLFLRTRKVGCAIHAGFPGRQHLYLNQTT